MGTQSTWDKKRRSKKNETDGDVTQTAPSSGEVVSLDSPSSPGSRGSSLYSAGHSDDENRIEEGSAANTGPAVSAATTNATTTDGDGNPSVTACVTDLSSAADVHERAQSAKQNPMVTVNITFQKKKREAEHRAETTVAWMLEHYEKKILASKWASSGGISALQVCDEDGLPLSSDVTLRELRDSANSDSGSQDNKVHPVKLVFQPC